MLRSDLEAMRAYLDATRDTSTSTLGGRKQLASTPAVDISDIPPRASCGPSYATSSHSTRDMGPGMETDLDDIMQELSTMQLTMARVQEGVESLDRKMEQHTMSSGPEQSRRRHPRLGREVLATAIMKLLKCSICHLMTRPPVTVTTCCRQWLGCHRCMLQCTARRCPLCNRTWGDTFKPMCLRGLDDLTKVAKHMRLALGKQHLHSRPTTHHLRRNCHQWPLQPNLLWPQQLQKQKKEQSEQAPVHKL